MLRKKINGFQQAKPLCKKLQNDQDKAIVSVRSDHGRKFINSSFELFCIEFGIQFFFFF